jgi:hypothetical protein
MRKEDFKTVLIEWKSFQFPKMIEREYEIPLDSTNIISLVGVRRSGKTFLVLMLTKKLSEKLPKDNILYVNFEHELLRNLEVRDLRELVEAYNEIFQPLPEEPKYLLLDEIQSVKGWEKWVRRIYDQRKFRIYITGSTSKLSPREIARSLRGRTVNFTIYPFSFREFLKAKNFEAKLEEIPYLEEKKGQLLRLLREYIEFGSFPEVILKEDKNEKIKLLDSYFDTILYRDLIERFKIKEIRLLEEFMRYAINNSANYFSLTKAENFFRSKGEKCSKRTFLNFLNYARSSFLLFPVEILSPKVKDRLQYSKKIYCIDTGLINFINPRFSENFGKLMENVCFIELLRKKEKIPQLQVFYWKAYGRKGKEVDFVLKEGLKVKQLIQVTYASRKDEINEREIKALLKASKELKCKDLLVITWDYEDQRTMNNRAIKFIPLWKWLLI